jgi:uncharacterized membrane protein YbaN (DUF454 family)
MKYILAFLGIVSLGLGVAGIFLPLLPTTPFLLLSAALFARSSRRLHCWLLHHRVLGEYIRSFMQEKAIPLRIKIYAVTVLWITMLCTVFFAVEDKIWLQTLLCILAACITAHILSYKTKK